MGDNDSAHTRSHARTHSQTPQRLQQRAALTQTQQSGEWEAPVRSRAMGKHGCSGGGGREGEGRAGDRQQPRAIIPRRWVRQRTLRTQGW